MCYLLLALSWGGDGVGFGDGEWLAKKFEHYSVVHGRLTYIID